MARVPQIWHPEDIKAALRKRFGALNALSRSWGLHPTAVSDTLRRPRYSTITERRISAALGVPLHELWPDRWDRHGNPLPRVTAAKGKGAPKAPERQKRAAA